jgi:DNA-binding NtrC family response regulator
VAKAIHFNSDRKKKGFVAVNMAERIQGAYHQEFQLSSAASQIDLSYLEKGR